VLALLTRSFGQKAMEGHDTFTVPQKAQAAGRIQPVSNVACRRACVNLQSGIKRMSCGYREADGPGAPGDRPMADATSPSRCSAKRATPTPKSCACNRELQLMTRAFRAHCH
jgi:hypothetical protein